MNKEQAIKELGIEGSFDYAIPETFNEQIYSFIDCPPSHFIWSYGDNSIFGYPRPLTETGRVALEKYNKKYGTFYNTEVKVLMT